MNRASQMTGSSKGLKPYPAYKYSGVEWLGDVPVHWEVRRLKGLVTNVAELVKGKGSEEIYLSLERVESWTGRLINAGDGVEFDSQVKRFRAKDVLFGKLRPYLGKVTCPNQGGVCVGEFLVLRANAATLSPAYLEQLLRSKSVIDAVDASTFGARMPRANWEFIGSMRLPFPPLPEQRSIVRFLDHVDHRIRRYIRAKERLIKLLEEQRQAIIHQAVTGQIDVRTGQPYPAYKNSGVEWLGKVPEHWRVAALRYRYEQCLGKMLDAKRITGRRLVPYLRNVDVQWDKINVSDLPRMDIQSNEVARYTVQPGDLLVCEGGEVGRCAIWEGEIDRCGFQKALHRLRPRNDQEDNPRFLYFTLSVASKRGAFTDGHESTIAHLTGEKLRAHRFAFPPLHEQAAIIEYLDKAISDFNAVIALARRQTELFQEYRTRLIADVVTGKLDVREAAASLPDQERSKGQSAKY